MNLQTIDIDKLKEEIKYYIRGKHDKGKLLFHLDKLVEEYKIGKYKTYTDIKNTST